MLALPVVSESIQSAGSRNHDETDQEIGAITAMSSVLGDGETATSGAAAGRMHCDIASKRAIGRFDEF